MINFGRNLAIEYMGPTPLKRRWRDLGGVIEGPAVRVLDEIFLADWAFASGQPLNNLKEVGPSVNCRTFSPNGTLLAIAGDDRCVRLWDVASRHELWAFNIEGQPWKVSANDSAAHSRAEKYVAYIIDRAIEVCKFQRRPLALDCASLDAAWNSYFGCSSPV